MNSVNEIFECNLRNLVKFLVSKAKIKNIGLISQYHEVMPIAYLSLDLSLPESYNKSDKKIAIELIYNKIDSFNKSDLQIEKILIAKNKDFIFEQFIREYNKII